MERVVNEIREVVEELLVRLGLKPRPRPEVVYRPPTPEQIEREQEEQARLAEERSKIVQQQAQQQQQQAQEIQQQQQAPQEQQFVAYPLASEVERLRLVDVKRVVYANHEQCYWAVVDADPEVRHVTLQLCMYWWERIDGGEVLKHTCTPVGGLFRRFDSPYFCAIIQGKDYVDALNRLESLKRLLSVMPEKYSGFETYITVSYDGVWSPTMIMASEVRVEPAWEPSPEMCRLVCERGTVEQCADCCCEALYKDVYAPCITQLGGFYPTKGELDKCVEEGGVRAVRIPDWCYKR